MSSVLLVAHHIQREALGDFLQHALRLLGLLEQLGDLLGDGTLSSFHSAVDAVACARALTAPRARRCAR